MFQNLSTYNINETFDFEDINNSDENFFKADSNIDLTEIKHILCNSKELIYDVHGCEYLVDELEITLDNSGNAILSVSDNVELHINKFTKQIIHRLKECLQGKKIKIVTTGNYVEYQFFTNSISPRLEKSFSSYPEKYNAYCRYVIKKYLEFFEVFEIDLTYMILQTTDPEGDAIRINDGVIRDIIKKANSKSIAESFDFGFDNDIEQTDDNPEEQETFFQADTNDFKELMKEYCKILEKYELNGRKIDYKAFNQTTQGVDAPASCTENNIIIRETDEDDFIKELAIWYSDAGCPSCAADTHKYVSYGTSRDSFSFFRQVSYNSKTKILISFIVRICKIIKDYVPSKNFLDFCKFGGIFGYNNKFYTVYDRNDVDNFRSRSFNDAFVEVHNTSEDIFEYAIECAKSIMFAHATTKENFVFESSISLSQFANMSECERELYFTLYNIGCSINFMEIKDSTVEAIKLIEEHNKLFERDPERVSLHNLAMFTPRGKDMSLHFLGDNTNSKFFAFLSTLRPFMICFNCETKNDVPKPESNFMKKTSDLGMSIIVNNYVFDRAEAEAFVQSILMHCIHPNKISYKRYVHVKFYNCKFDLDAVNVLTNASYNSISQYSSVQTGIEKINQIKNIEKYSSQTSAVLRQFGRDNLPCYTLDFDKKCQMHSQGEISFSGYNRLNLVIFESPKTISGCSFAFEKPLSKEFKRENWNLTVVVGEKAVPVSSDFQENMEIYDTALKRIMTKRFSVPCKFINRSQWEKDEKLTPDEF